MTKLPKRLETYHRKGRDNKTIWNLNRNPYPQFQSHHIYFSHPLQYKFFCEINQSIIALKIIFFLEYS